TSASVRTSPSTRRRCAASWARPPRSSPGCRRAPRAAWPRAASTSACAPTSSDLLLLLFLDCVSSRSRSDDPTHSLSRLPIRLAGRPTGDRSALFRRQPQRLTHPRLDLLLQILAPGALRFHLALLNERGDLPGRAVGPLADRDVD